MPYYMMYYLEVLKGRDREFLEAWKTFSNEIQAIYKVTGSTIFRTETGMYVVTSVWPSKEAWQKFWVTKEISIESLTQVKSCLMRPSQPVELQPVFSNWHLIEVSETAVTQPQPAKEPHYEVSEISILGAQQDGVFVEEPEKTLIEVARIHKIPKKTG